jgi:mono/diheme cytochrome c family protein
MMRAKRLISVTTMGAAAVLFSLALIAQVPTAETSQAVEAPSAAISTQQALLQDDGKQLYNRECAACHGRQGRGNGRAGRDMSPRPTDITSLEYLDENSDEDIFKVIAEGAGEMDPYRDLFTDEQIQAVIGYVRELGEKRKK